MSKVKVVWDKKRAVHSQHPALCTKWDALVADNVAQAAGATIRSLQRGFRDACAGPGGLLLGSAMHF